MGLHHQNNHGRVFRGLDATKHLEMHKRDSHGDHIKLNVPDHIKAAARPADPALADIVPADKAVDAVTLTSVVYQTLSATFDGPIAGYSTLSAEDASTTAAATSSKPTPANADESSYAAAKAAATAKASTTATSVATVVPTSSAAVSTDDGSNNKSRFLNPPTSAATTASATFTAAGVVGTPLTHTSAGGPVVGTPLQGGQQISNQSDGMSAGGKAGLAFGIIIALALAGGLLFFCWRRRRNPNANHETLNEKRISDGSSFFGGRAMSEKHASVASQQSARTAATAPRLSLRPVTQFLPNLGNNRQSSGNHLDVASAMSEKPKSMWERRSHTAQNPFEDANQLSEKQARPETPPTNPFDEPEDERAVETSPSKAQVATASAVAVTAGTASVSPPRAPEKNVHRVQLDFKPSMDDELELKSGQLVRMLHEYDDGWVSHE
jgi:hypothetical protein